MPIGCLILDLSSCGRGIAIFTHTSIEKSSIQIQPELACLACLLEIKLRDGDTILFACFYRSPTPTEKSNDNNTKLNNLLRSISRKKYSHYCILGDFNYRDIKWQTWTTPHNEGSKKAIFIETIRDCFLHQHINRHVDVEMTKHRWSTLSSSMKPCKSLTLSTMLH